MAWRSGAQPASESCWASRSGPLLTLVGSALPVRLPRGTQQAVAIAPILAAIFLGGPAGRLGRRDRDDRGARTPGPNPLVRHPSQSRRACAASDSLGVVRDEFLPLGESLGLIADFVARDARGGASSYVLNVWLVSILLALRTGQPLVSVLVGDSRGTLPVASSRLRRLAGSWPSIYLVQWWATLLFALPLYTTRTGLPALRRDARDVHADHRRAGGGRRQARPVHGAAQPPGQGRSPSTSGG